MQGGVDCGCNLFRYHQTSFGARRGASGSQFHRANPNHLLRLYAEHG